MNRRYPGSSRLIMTKWLTTEKEHTNDGVRVQVSCPRAGICRSALVPWSESPDPVILRLQQEIEGELFPGGIKDIVVSRGCLRDKDLNVIFVAKYEPYSISVTADSRDFESVRQAEQKASADLVDLIWQTRLEQREQGDAPDG